jgi:hypothetical protein
MKKILLIAIVIFAGLAACSPKEESSEPVIPTTADTTGSGSGGGGGGGGTPTPVQPTLTTADPIQFWGLVDGALSTYTAGGGSTQLAQGKDSTPGMDSTTASYVSGMINSLDQSGILTKRGKISFPNGTVPTEANFMSLFSTGTKTFSTGIAEISLFTTPSLTEWTTAGGDQTGSTYEITQVTSTGTPAEPKYKVVIKFECKVYKATNPSLSKTITKGIMVTEFAAK